MKIYISGQITGIEKQAPALFEAAESFLKAKGFEVVNPMKLPHNHDRAWHSFMREDLTELLKCDAIYMLDNYQKSNGAKLEWYNAIWLEMPVFYEQYQFALDKYQEQPEKLVVA